jgi:hypothetical protein
MGIHQYRRKPNGEVELPESGFLTYKQASKYLNLPVGRLRILQRTGKLKRIPERTNAHLFTREELERYRREQAVLAQPLRAEFETRLAELDARVTALESSMETLTSQLTEMLTILQGMELEKLQQPAVSPELTDLAHKVKAAFEHLGVNFKDITRSGETV